MMNVIDVVVNDRCVVQLSVDVDEGGLNSKEMVYNTMKLLAISKCTLIKKTYIKGKLGYNMMYVHDVNDLID